MDVTYSMGTVAALSDKCYTEAANGATQPNCPSLTLPNYNAATVTGATIESHPAGGGITAQCMVCPFGACPVPVPVP